MKFRGLAARNRVLGIVCLIAWTSLLLFAKGSTSKITIESARLTGPITIVDPAVLTNFQVYAGPGTSTGETTSLIVDWASGKVPAAPKDLERYRVSFDVGREHPYVVLYAYDTAARRGYVYLPGKDDEWYRTNVFLIYRRLEGNWFRASEAWDKLAGRLIEKR